jgi:citronellol/citronellal dehydrogenase
VTPLKRFAQEAEVSAAIVYLLSPAAAYLTGTCIRIDGGASLNPNAMDVGGGGGGGGGVGGTAFRGFHRASEPEVLQNHQSRGG